MKNITIAIDEETHRAARVRAAELGTSVSALVKGYLQGLVAGDSAPETKGMREMPMPFASQPVELLPVQKALPPGAYGWSADGKPYYTKDGKPRKPGALRDLPPLPDDFDDWPEDILASFEAWPYDDPDYVPADFDWPELPAA